MGVDQPRHDDAPAGLDDGCIPAGRRVEPARLADCQDFAALEPDLPVLDDPVAPVEGEHRSAADDGDVAVGCRLGHVGPLSPESGSFQSVVPCNANG